MEPWIKKSPILLILICLSLQAALTVPTLETERCILRPISVDDTPEIFILASDPQIARYTLFFGQRLHTSYEETCAFIERCLKMHSGEYGMNWVIIEKYSSTIIGAVALFGYSAVNRKAEFGYALSPAYWDKGIMTEVSKALITSLFTQLNLVRLQATVDPENEASVRVLVKCGMQYEGLLHNYYILHDESRNRAMYALTQKLRRYRD